MNRWTWSFLMLLAGATALADDRITELTGELESLKSRFEQRVVDESGRVVEESAGTFALQSPNLFRWHYVGDYEQLIVADGERVWMHDVELEQVTVKAQEQAETSSPLSVLTRPETLEERYQVSYGQAEDYEIVTLEPRMDEAEFEWVELAFRDEILEFLIIQDAFGQQTRIRFIDPQYNVDIEPEAFQFTPPEGVDVLGTEELLGDG